MSHNHHHHEATDKNLSVSILLNIGITIGQVIGGILSGSLSLISDALHNFSDVLSLVSSLVAHRLAKRKASEKHTFGYKRAEIVSAFINAATLVLVAAYLIYEAAVRFTEPVAIGSGIVIWLSLLGIAFNGFSAILLKKDAASSLNIRSAYLHLFTDMLASVAVLAGGLLMKYFGWFWVDSVITFGIAIYLVYMGFDVLRSSLGMLMLFTPDGLSISAIAGRLHTVTRGNRLYHIHLWQLTDHELHFQAHLDCCDDMTVSRFNAIVADIEGILHREFHIDHCTIQPDFGKECGKDFVIQE